MIRPLENEEVLVGKPARTLIIRVFMIVGASWQEKTFQLPRNSPVTRFCQIRTKTDTGGLVEYTKASEITILKELGNTTGRTFGRCPPQAIGAQ